jgi:iron complex outermembrane receptor protein
LHGTNELTKFIGKEGGVVRQKNMKIDTRCFPLNLVIITIFLFSLFFFQICEAEEEIKAEEKRVIKLDKISVTATRTVRPIIDVPSSVTVINTDQIEASPFERVEDILRTEVGIDNVRHYGSQTGGIKGPIDMRGVTGGITQRTLMLIDGVPQNDNANNSIGWIAWSQIPKDAIERIEIVRGPSSALYGSEGLGGVINIITKKPKETREASLTFKYGESDTHSEEAFFSQKFDRFGVLLNGQYEESDGFYMVEPRQDYEIEKYRRSNRLLAKLSYDIDDMSDISFGFLRYEHKMNKGREYFYGEKEDYRYWIEYSRSGQTLDWKALAYVNDDDKTAYIDKNYTTANREERFPVITWGAELQSSINFSETSVLTVGAAYKDVHFETEYIYLTTDREYEAGGDQNFISPFLNYEKKFFDDQLIFNVGGRYDFIESDNGKERDTGTSKGYGLYDKVYPEKTWEEFSPKGGVVFRPDKNTAIRASIGKGFRAPTLFELYKTHTRSGNVTIANPNLEPEKIVSYELGAERVFFDTIWTRITYYRSYAKDLIASRAEQNWYKRDNLDEVKIHGVEVELKWAATDWLSLFANYTYNSTRIEKDPVNPENEGNLIDDYPKHKARAGVMYSDPRFLDVNVNCNYRGKRYQNIENTIELEDFITFDLSVSRKLFDHVELSLNVENIFDKKYIFAEYDDYDSVSPGRIVMGKVKFRF